MFKYCMTIVMLCFPLAAKADCFLIMENDKIVSSEGECKKRYAPCSTFKIPLSLMFYDDGLLIDENNPELPFKEGYVDYVERWKQGHNPTTWMKNSCVWYSQVMTQTLGINKFTDYVKKFDYGNKDISGDKGKNNGLTNSWLSSSLEISPVEQANFLKKLIDNKLPVSEQSQEMTKNIMFVEELSNGWKLYGKTGSGSLLSKDRTKKLDIQHGWFVGWIEKEDRKVIFANHIADNKKQDSVAGPRAKAGAIEKLLNRY